MLHKYISFVTLINVWHGAFDRNKEEWLTSIGISTCRGADN